ncbi:hypothetical protein HMI55_006434 [Coelomomyces lativittatus]|nr:hypothetical protein HMI55_006434 [Coelomomyces lativittatus]
MDHTRVQGHSRGHSREGVGQDAPLSGGGGVVPMHQVTAFIKKAITRTFPLALWGGLENFKVVWTWVQRYLHLQLYESIRVHDVVQKIKIKQIHWLTGGQSFSPLLAYQHATLVFKEFIYWFFIHFLIPLLKSSFYITHTQPGRKSIVYFPHATWQRMCQLDPMCYTPTSLATPSTLMTHNTKVLVTYQLRRFLPKSSGTRTLLQYHPGSKEDGLELKFIANLIKHRLLTHPELLGGGVLYLSHAHEKIQKFFLTLNTHHPGKRLYGIKIDIKRAYDSIPIQTLLKYLPQCFHQFEYKVQKSDQLKVDSYSKDDLLRILQHLLLNTCFKFKNQVFRQLHGIPQGCMLSPLLCSFFYGQMEKKYFGFLNQHPSLFLRYMDDILLLSVSTSDLQKAIDLFQSDEVKQEFGVHLNMDKSYFQFKDPSLVLPWCGVLIHPQNRFITNDFTSYESCGITASITLVNSKHCRTLKRKWKWFLKTKYRKELFDWNINPCPILLNNAYELFYFTALKSVAYLKQLKKRNIFPTSTLILNAIQGVYFQFYQSTFQAFPCLSSFHQGYFHVKKSTLFWFVLQAYHQVLIQHPLPLINPSLVPMLVKLKKRTHVPYHERHIITQHDFKQRNTPNSLYKLRL